MARVIATAAIGKDYTTKKMDKPGITSFHYTVDEVLSAASKALEIGVERFSPKKSLGFHLKVHTKEIRRYIARGFEPSAAVYFSIHFRILFLR